MTLHGIRVLDVATAMAGPYTTTLLADLGAEVVKIEKPRRGDLTRFSDRDINGQSSYFVGINRGKRAMTVDLRTASGQEIVRRLVSTADVLVENYRPGMMDTWDLGYTALHEINPRLVYCSISAYGDAVGYGQATGNDMTCQAYSGLMDMTGDPDGPPERVGAPVVDTATAMHAALGIVAALYRRRQVGDGEHIKISLIETAFALMPNYVASIVNSGTQFHRVGLGHPRFSPYGGFKCADDKWLVVGTFHNRSWDSLCRALERTDLLTDPRYRENWDRTANKQSLDKELSEVMIQRTRDCWAERFQEFDVPCAPVLSVNEAVARYVQSNPAFVHPLIHAELGEILVQSPAITFTDRPLPRVARPAPALGEDNDQLLTEAGYSPEQIAQFLSDGVI